MVYDYQTRTLYEHLKKTMSLLLCVLHHVDISYHIEPLTFGYYSNCLTSQGGWWTNEQKLTHSLSFFIHCHWKYI